MVENCGPELPLLFKMHKVWSVDSQENHTLLPPDVRFYGENVPNCGVSLPASTNRSKPASSFIGTPSGATNVNLVTSNLQCVNHQPAL